MKKHYIAPACESLALPTGRLFNTTGSMPVSNETADEGGWSKKFWGGSIFDDTDEETEIDD
ncbi:MAG: hypothetical protein IJT90_01610 [Bacteroidaceae bacterium]|nr:hypothetical protein [Bacteroidaceae bacterium]